MEDWDAQMMLDRYVHDYMVRRNMHATAEVFAEEANVCLKPVAIDSPEGFLTEWWSFFWDIYSARLRRHPEATENSSFKVAQIAGDVSQIIRPMTPRLYMNCMLQNFGPAMLMPGLPNLPQTVHSTVMARPDMENLLQNTLPSLIMRPELNPNILEPPTILDFNIGKEQTLTNLISASVHEQECRRLPARDLNYTSPLLNVEQLAHMLPSASKSRHPKKKASKKPQRSFLRTGGYYTNLLESAAKEPMPHVASKANQHKSEPADTGTDKEGKQVSPTGWPSSVVGCVVNSLVPNQRQQVSACALNFQQSVAKASGKLILSSSGSLTNLGSPNLVVDCLNRKYSN